MTQKRILLLEPDIPTSRIIREYLERSGAVIVDTAHSAQEAVHIADEHTPDIVIVELAIREHNGFAFLHEFRSYPEWAHIPVIVHSHLDVEEAAASQHWKTLGAVDYFYKPNTTLKQLDTSVRSTLLS